MADHDQDRLLMPPPKMPPSSVPTAKSSAFSESTKLKTKEIHGDDCWLCGTTPTHVCHVVAQEDRQVSAKQMAHLLCEYDTNTFQALFWADRGLLDFQLTSFLNAIPLCPSCHVNFDNDLDPGFSFIPTDIEYFVEFELEDRQRRRAAEEEGKTGEDLQRRVPSAAQYRQHQITKGEIGPDVNGGLYRPIYLLHYLNRKLMSFDDMRSHLYARPWHGAPLVCFRRCFLLLGGGRLGGVLDTKSICQLQRLHGLYFYEDDHWSTLYEHHHLATKTESREVNRKQSDHDHQRNEKRKKSDHEKSNEEPVGKKNRATEGADAASGPDTTYCPVLQRQVHAAWNLGPNVSTEDAVRRFAPIISNGKPSTLCAI